MPKITINNRAMNYLDEGEGPVLLFGHSYLWDSNMWREQVVGLSKSFRCIVPDLWGHGDSDVLSDTPTIQSLANDHWQLMQALGIDRFSVIGLSVGGMWGTQLALDHPEAVEKLVIMDSFVGVEPAETQQRYFQMLDVVAQLNMVPPPMIEQLLPVFLSEDSREYQPQLAAGLAESLAGIPAQNISTVVAIGRAIFGREDLMRCLPELTMPVLVMAGEFDLPRPPHEAHLMAAAIPGARCEVIAKAGHISALEQPVQVNALLQVFLAG